MAMMQAVQVGQYGAPTQLKVATVPRPEPQQGEILVKVYAAGVLPMDCAIRQGCFAAVMPKVLPYIPGTAFAGVVEAVGRGVTNFKVGDAICGRAPQGTYAEYTTVLANPPAIPAHAEGYKFTGAISPLALKPAPLSFDEAATLSAGATTAWTALFADGNVHPGQRVLIHAAAGGVGLFAVQFAKWKGAEVIGTASTQNVDFVRSIGADSAIDYTTTRFDEIAKEVDFVLDTIGGDTLERSMHTLKPGGTVVSVVEQPDPALAEKLGIHAIKNAVFPTSEHLRQIVEVIDAGHARPTIQQLFSLQEAPQAQALCETGHGRGRIVLHIAD